MSSWLQFKWLSEGEQFVNIRYRQVKEACELLESHIERLSRTGDISVSRVPDAKYKALSAAEDNISRVFIESADTGQRLKSLIHLRLVRDQLAKAFGLSSYTALREQRDMRSNLETGYRFLQSVDQAMARMFAPRERLELFRPTDNLCHFVPLVSVQRVLELASRALETRLGLSLAWPAHFGDVDLATVRVFDGPALLGFIMIDVRHNRAARYNQTIPIARGVAADGQMQKPIVLVSLRFDPRCRLINFWDAISLLHEMGHAIDHLTDVAVDPTRSGLGARPIDELEVCGRWMEAFAEQPEFVETVGEGMSPSQKRILGSAVSSLRRDRYLANLPLQIAVAAFDILLYRTPVESSNLKGFLPLVSRIAAEDFILLGGLSLPKIVLNMDLTNVDRYQCANHSYLWSHSLATDAERVNTASLPTPGGLHRALTSSSNREHQPRAQRLVEALIPT